MRFKPPAPTVWLPRHGHMLPAQPAVLVAQAATLLLSASRYACDCMQSSGGQLILKDTGAGLHGAARGVNNCTLPSAPTPMVSAAGAWLLLAWMKSWMGTGSSPFHPGNLSVSSM